MRWYPTAMSILLAGLLTIAGCKRKPEKAPVIDRQPAMAGPTSQDIAKEKEQKLIEGLEPVPALGAGTIAKTPDGEVWTLYPSGLMTHDLKPADGADPKWGQILSIAYVGTFPNSQDKPFDKRTADNPLTFAFGSKDVIKGLNMGVSNMHVGQRRRIFVPPDLGYGLGGSPLKSIAPNQALIFEVELLSVTGEGYDMPKIAVPTTGAAGPPAPDMTTTVTTAPASAPG